MNFSIAQTIARLRAPRHEISCSWLLWQRLCARLRERGRNATRESGAFLLGYRADGRARITSFILYDDLDPRALDTGIVHFDGRYFGALWDICKQCRLSVVADVHVHPGGARQSSSDRDHPMVSRAGHIAFILPDFARPPMMSESVGIYRYLGGKHWQTIPEAARRTFFHIGL